MPAGRVAARAIVVAIDLGARPEAVAALTQRVGGDRQVLEAALRRIEIRNAERPGRTAHEAAQLLRLAIATAPCAAAPTVSVGMSGEGG